MQLEIVPARWWLDTVDYELPLPGGHRVLLRAGLADGRVVADEIAVIRTPASGPVTAEVLRQVALEPFYERVRHHVVDERGRGFLSMFRHPVKRVEWQTRGANETKLKAVADVYRVAFAMGAHPTQSVEQVTGLPRATAARYVDLARKRGFLGLAKGPGKAGVTDG